MLGGILEGSGLRTEIQAMWVIELLAEKGWGEKLIFK